MCAVHQPRQREAESLSCAVREQCTKRLKAESAASTLTVTAHCTSQGKASSLLSSAGQPRGWGNAWRLSRAGRVRDSQRIGHHLADQAQVHRLMCNLRYVAPFVSRGVGRCIRGAGCSGGRGAKVPAPLLPPCSSAASRSSWHCRT